MPAAAPHVLHLQAPFADQSPLTAIDILSGIPHSITSPPTTLATQAISLTSSSVYSTFTGLSELHFDRPDALHIQDTVNTPQTDPSAVSPMVRGRRCSVGLLSAFLSYFTLFSLHRHFDRGGHTSETKEESAWIASSPSWLDRQSCRWFGVCGAFHLNQSGWVGKAAAVGRDQESQMRVLDDDGAASFWTSGDEDPDQWSHEERISREIPSYVYEYTPYVHLFSDEEFWPCDIANHLVHTTPYLNYTPVQSKDHGPTLEDLDDLNRFGRSTYLQSNDNVEERPNWLGGSKNIPSTPDYQETRPTTPGRPRPFHGGPGETSDEAEWFEAGIGDIKMQGGIRPNPFSPSSATPSDTKQGEDVVVRRGEMEEIVKHKRGKGEEAGGRSSAPAVLVVVPKGNGVVDAFWFYFYSYNLGNKVLNVRFGNHVGDWEHSVVRFHHGVPKALFLSEHNFGEAYSYAAVEKKGDRPVIYSATGTHAMYATPGLHPYVLPWGMLHDETDKGPLWDPLLNHHAYVYNYTTRVAKASTQTPKAPVNWFNYDGHWGDKFYPLNDSRQYRFAGQYHYVNGPFGPKFKNLGRKKICQGNKECVLKHWLPGDGDGPAGDVKELDSLGELNNAELVE